MVSPGATKTRGLAPNDTPTRRRIRGSYTSMGSKQRNITERAFDRTVGSGRKAVKHFERDGEIFERDGEIAREVCALRGTRAPLVGLLGFAPKVSRKFQKRR